MQVDPVTIARLFDLGSPVGPARPLPGRSTARVWSLRTDRGRWVVKIVQPYGAAELAALDRAFALENAARAAGVATPRPVPPADGAGYWADVGPVRARVFEYVEGTAPSVPLPAAVATWLGTAVATMAALALPAPPPAPLSIVDDHRLTPALRTAVTGLAAVVDAAPPQQPPAVLLHGDISRHNILVGPHGPVLLDFDGATAQTPWREIVHHAFLLSCADLGPQEPDPTTIHCVLSAYVDAGGVTGPADHGAFAGLARGLLHWLEVNRRAAPHDPHAVAAVARAEVALPRILAALPRWSALLA